MQNKPNLPDAQMNVNTVITKDYENEHLRWRRENKPNSKPIKANQTQYKPNFKPGAYAQDDGMVPRMYFAILGGWWRSSVKW